MPRKKYTRKPGSRPIGRDRRYKVRSKRQRQLDRRKYVAAMARYAVAQAEKEAQDYEAEAKSASAATRRQFKPSNTAPDYKAVPND